MQKALSLTSWITIFICSLLVIAFSAGVILCFESVEFASNKIVFNLIQTGVFDLDHTKIAQLLAPKTLKQAFILEIVNMVIFLFIIVMVCSELDRARKHQYVPKPLEKVILFLVILFLVLTGKLFLFIIAIIILVTIVLLEIISYSVEALNTFAEERNLISIHNQERKFERQVNKKAKMKWSKRQKIGKGKFDDGKLSKWRSKNTW